MNHCFPPAQGERAAAAVACPAAPVRSLADQLNALLVQEIECGLIVCDGQCSVQFANHSALQELASCRLLRLAGDRLDCVARQGTELNNALRLAVSKGRRQLLQLSAAGDRLLVAVAPLQPGDSSPGWALLMLGRRKPCSELGLEMLAKVYRLTMAEQRVLAGLLGAASAREIAAERKVGLATVRSQIKAIREKMGASTIDSVLLRTAEVPPLASALRLVAGSGLCAASANQPLYPLPMAA